MTAPLPRTAAPTRYPARRAGTRSSDAVAPKMNAGRVRSTSTGMIDRAARHEITIASGKSSATKTLKASVVNADYMPLAENPGDPITLSASTTCTGLTLGVPVCDPTTASNEVTVRGGAAKTRSSPL